MKIIRARDYDHMSSPADHIISAQVIPKPESALGLAPGSSPIGTYRQLIAWYLKGDIDFGQVRTVNLDEYVGLAPENEQSYACFMRGNFFNFVNIYPANSYIPYGLNMNAEDECSRYDQIIHSLGGIDLQLLGLGPNGHIGFNEPDDCFTKGTHKVSLSTSTIQANKRFFEKEEDVPRYADAGGICHVTQARRVVMVVSGAAKAPVVKQALFGPVTPRCPASILQLHSDFTLVADEDALRFD